VDGVCQPIAPPVREVEAAAPLPPGPAIKKAKKPKVAAKPREEEHVPAAKVVRRERTEARLRAAVTAPPAMVCKDQPCAPPPPIPIEPAARFGSWGQVFGDYEHRDASGAAFVTTGGTPPIVPVEISVQSRTGTVGFQIGGDFTTRDVLLANDGVIAGAMTGFARSDLSLNTQSLSTNFSIVHNGSGHMDANLTGGMLGLYATYFNGGFSTDFLAKADVFSLGENFTDLLAFPVFKGLPPDCVPVGSHDCVFSKTDPIPVINTTVMDNLNYRFNVYPNFWIEPTVGVQYTHTSYLEKAARLGLADGDLVMVQGGARFGTTTLLDNHVLMTTILTGLAYDDVLVAGGFVPGLAFEGNNILAHADRGQVRGRGILALNFDFGQGISSYVLGEARGGKGLFGAGGKAGVRVVW
jgi:hypothetical protein